MTQVASNSRLFAAALPLLVAGCADAPTSRLPSETVTLSRAQVQALVSEARRIPRGIEDSFLDADERTGGFGGFLVDSSGVPFVWATRATGGFSVAEQLPPAIREAITADRLEGATRLEAEYRFSELVAYQVLAAKALRSEPSLVATDADERANRLRVVLSDMKRADHVFASLEGVGVPRGAVLLERGERSIAAATLRDRVRPTRGGLQVKTRRIGWWGTSDLTCTLGFNVTLAANSQRYALYNSHCTGTLDGNTGATVYQRNVVSGDVVGSVEINPTWTVTDPLCGTTIVCRYADAALVRYSLGASNTPSRIIYPCNFSSNPTLPGTVNTCGQTATVDNAATVFPWVGQPLQKVGRTSGWTVGLVIATCVNEITDHFEPGNPLPTSTMSLCSDQVSAFADGGDSGGPVFYHPTLIGASVVAPMGILHSYSNSPSGSPRTYRFSRRQLIEYELGSLVF